MKFTKRVINFHVLALLMASSHIASGQEFSNHVYQAVSGTMTWHEARIDAQVRGGHLATITSHAEYEFIRSRGWLPNFPYWIGASDERVEGVWVWVTGEPWEYTSWSSGQPSNTGNEDFLTVSSNTPEWNDLPDNYTLPGYLLEFDDWRCTPHKAKATAILTDGAVVGGSLTDGGCGYTNAPAVLIKGGGGAGATASAIVAGGEVTAIVILDGGCCYTSAPQIVIASPPFVPKVSIKVTKVNVIQEMVLGWKYILETSTNAVDWYPSGTAFIADSELIEKEMEVDTSSRQFRLRVVP